MLIVCNMRKFEVVSLNARSKGVAIGYRYSLEWYLTGLYEMQGAGLH